MIKIKGKEVCFKGTTIDLIHEYTQITDAMVDFLEENQTIQVFKRFSTVNINDLVDYLTSIIDAHKNLKQVVRSNK